MKAAVFQSTAHNMTTGERFELLAQQVEIADAELFMAPELFMSGYEIGKTVNQFAEPSNGPFATSVRQLATKTQTTIIYGYPESADDQIYNSAICIDKDGQTLANRRKSVLTAGYEADSFKPGNGMTFFKLGEFTCALLICFEAEFPELVRKAAQQGAQIICVPTALGNQWPHVAHKMMPTRAFENGVWFLYANHAGTENDKTYLGGSCICGPDGNDAARAGHEQELISTTLDSLAIRIARARIPFLKIAENLN